MLIEHLLDLGETEAAAELSIGDLDALLPGRPAPSSTPTRRSRTAPAQRVVLLQGGDAETLALWRLLVDAEHALLQRRLRKLGVLLTDDDIAGESIYNAAAARR